MINKPQKTIPIKVAFVIPFAFEKFFHFAKELRDNPIRFEDEIISQRDTWHFNWCKAMVSQGMDVTVYHISKRASEKRDYFHKSGIVIKRFPTSMNWLYRQTEYSNDMLRQIKRDQSDIVFSVAHIFTPMIDMYDWLAFYCKRNNIPIITRNAHADTYHHIFPIKIGKKTKFDKNIFLKSLRQLYYPVKQIRRSTKFFFKKRALKSTNCTLTQTEVDYLNLTNKFKINESQLKAFPKPIDLGSFYEIKKEVAATKLGLAGDKKYLLHVSNLFDTKGCEHIISILPKIKVQYADIILIVAGNGPKRHGLKKLAKQLNVESNVLFCGQISHDDLIYYYNIAEAFVLPTEIAVEGQPNVIMEAIACNTIPISTNLPGPSAVITEGLGLKIPVGNKEKLYYSIKQVLEGEYVMNQAFRKEFLKSYSLDNIGSELKQLIKKIISKNHYS